MVVKVVVKDILSISQQYDIFLVDMFGVIFNGDKFFDDVLDKLKALKENGKTVIFVSNTTQISSKCEENYAKRGLIKDCHYDKFVTSGDVMRQMFSDKKVRQIFKPNNDIFDQSDKPEYAYIGIPKINGLDVDISELFDKNGKRIYVDQLNHLDWNDVFLPDGQTTLGEFDKEIKDLDVPFLCANPDFFAFSVDSNGKLIPVLRQGAIAMRCQQLGKKVTYSGKPYKNIYDYAFKNCPLDKKILMVGDTPWTDITGANNVGIDSVLTLTGSYSFFLQMYDRRHSDENLEYFIDVFSRKFDLSNSPLKPTYIIERF